MRGSDRRSGSLFSYVDLEVRVRRNHPLRRIKLFVDAALEALLGVDEELKPKAGDDAGAPPVSGGRNANVDFKGQKRSNETHESSTDPEARLYRKGPGMEARLCFIGHALMENRSSLIVGTSHRIRNRIEEGFGWTKTTAGQRKTRSRGRGKVGWAFAFAAAAYNLVRLPRLVEAQA